MRSSGQVRWLPDPDEVLRAVRKNSYLAWLVLENTGASNISIWSFFGYFDLPRSEEVSPMVFPRTASSCELVVYPSLCGGVLPCRSSAAPRRTSKSTFGNFEESKDDPHPMSETARIPTIRRRECPISVRLRRRLAVPDRSSRRHERALSEVSENQSASAAVHLVSVTTNNDRKRARLRVAAFVMDAPLEFRGGPAEIAEIARIPRSSMEWASERRRRLPARIAQIAQIGGGYGRRGS